MKIRAIKHTLVLFLIVFVNWVLPIKAQSPIVTAAPGVGTATLRTVVVTGPVLNTVMTDVVAAGCNPTDAGDFPGIFIPGVRYTEYAYMVSSPTLLDYGVCSVNINYLNLPGCYGMVVLGTGNYGYKGRSAWETFEIKQSGSNSFFLPNQKNGLATLVADNHSRFPVSVFASNSFAWSFLGNSLGCTFETNIANGSVSIKAGTNTGTVTIVNGTCGQGTLDLIPPCPGNAGSGNESCPSCSISAVSANNSCIDVKIGLGWDLIGNTAGYLQIYTNLPSGVLGTPAGLQYNFQRGDIRVVTNAQGLSQVITPQVVADIETNSSSSYSIYLYSPTNVVLNPSTSNGYTLTNYLYRTITVEQPGGNTNDLLIIDSNGQTNEYAWQGNGFLLTSGGGIRNVLKTGTNSTDGTFTTNTTTVYATGGSNVSSTVQIYTNSAFGQLLTCEIDGTGTNAQTNTYAYTANGYVQQSVSWTGFWQYYVYDSNNRPVQVFSSYGNQGPTTNPALCEMVVNDFTTNNIAGSGDNGYQFFNTPRRSITYIQGTEVSRNYFVALNGCYSHIQCVEPGAAWNAANNLVTKTIVFTNNTYLYYEPFVVQRPDGTGDVYEYGTIGTTTTNIVWSGHLDQSGTNVDAGTETIQILGQAGQVLTNTVIDVRSGLVTDQELYSYDYQNHLTNTVYLDGTTSEATYDCCTMTSSQARDGTTTYYTYDALQRLIASTTAGVTYSNLLDAAGNILATYTLSASNQVITNSQFSYDQAGNLLQITDAIGNITSYTRTFDSAGELIDTTTNPDGSTFIKTIAVDGNLAKVAGTAAYPQRYVYGTELAGTNQWGHNATNTYVQTIKLDSFGNDTTESSKTYSDAASRDWKTTYPDNSFSFKSFNVLGEVVQVTDPDGVTVLLQHDNLANAAYTAVDMNSNGIIDFGGSDRIVQITNDVVFDHNCNVYRTRTFTWIDKQSAPILSETFEASVDGLRTWDNQYGVNTFTETAYDGIGDRFFTNSAPDNSYTTTVYQNGRLRSTTQFDSTGAQLLAVTYDYDGFGRPITSTDARNGTTTNLLDGDGNVVSITSPSPDGIRSGLVVSNIYDSMRRIVQVVHPDGAVTTNTYYPTGLLEETSGSRIYPVEYTYDAQGRIKTMTTWTNFAAGSGSATTTWNYDSLRGFLISKQYNDGNGPSYTNSPAGRLLSRVWARGTITSYAYDPAGELNRISYSDTTPGVAIQYDRRGRVVAAIQGTTTNILAYNDIGQQLSLTIYGGSLTGVSLTNSYDALSRRINSTVSGGGLSSRTSTTYRYDAASRLYSVSDGTNSGTYSYIANSPLISQIAYQQNGQVRMTTRKMYDYLNRLTSIQSLNPSQSTLNSFQYQYNLASQRAAVTNEHGNYWVYQYDSLGQVVSGKKYWNDGTPVAGQQFSYSFDTIGNRQMTGQGGDQTGGNLRSTTYTANLLNQYTQRSVPGAVDIIGSANSDATVTVNAQRPYRNQDYFWKQLELNNSNGAIWQSVTNLAVLNRGTNADLACTNVGYVFLSQTPESYSYDADGNILTDGRWAYSWDAENRLVNMVSLTNAPNGSQMELNFTYDYRGRRIQKVVSTFVGGSYVSEATNRFIYDKWNVVGILDATTNLLYSFNWGLDLSGGLKGAGGTGGLLWMTSYSGTNSGSYFYNYDGIGNVVSLVAATNGMSVAQYDYGPFGNLLRATGPIAAVNPFTFASKYRDSENGYEYYVFRFFNPDTGRWLSRDPVTELGGINLYCFVGNQPLNYFDALGLQELGVSTATQTLPDNPSLAPIPNLTTEAEIDEAVTAAGEIVEGVSIGEGLTTVGTIAGATIVGGVGAYSAFRNIFLPDAELNPGGVNAPIYIPVVSLPIPEPTPQSLPVLEKGVILEEGQYRDHEGNIRDASGEIIVDKNGNSLKLLAAPCQKKDPFFEKFDKLFAAEGETLTAYRAINPAYADTTEASGQFYQSGAAGRLGNDGIYANTTPEGAIAEFQYHNPGVDPAVFEVQYPASPTLNISPPSGYFSSPLPFTGDANILAAPSLRAPGTVNMLIRNGAVPGARIQ